MPNDYELQVLKAMKAKEKLLLRNIDFPTARLATQGGFFLQQLRSKVLKYSNHIMEEAVYEQCKDDLTRYIPVAKQLDIAMEKEFGEDYLSIPSDTGICKYKWAAKLLTLYTYDDICMTEVYPRNTGSKWRSLIYQRVDWLLKNKMNPYDHESAPEFDENTKRFLPTIVGEIAGNYRG